MRNPKTEPTFSKVVKQDAKNIDNLLKHSKTDCHNCILYPDDCSIFRGRKFHPCSEFGSKAERVNAAHRRGVGCPSAASGGDEQPQQPYSFSRDFWKEEALRLKAEISRMQRLIDGQLTMMGRKDHEIAKLTAEKAEHIIPFLKKDSNPKNEELFKDFLYQYLMNIQRELPESFRAKQLQVGGFEKLAVIEFETRFLKEPFERAIQSREADLIKAVTDLIEKAELRITKGIAYDFDKQKLGWHGEIIGLRKVLEIIKEMKP